MFSALQVLHLLSLYPAVIPYSHDSTIEYIYSVHDGFSSYRYSASEFVKICGEILRLLSHLNFANKPHKKSRHYGTYCGPIGLPWYLIPANVSLYNGCAVPSFRMRTIDFLILHITLSSKFREPVRANRVTKDPNNGCTTIYGPSCKSKESD